MKNIITLLFCTLLFVQNTNAQITLIPDPAFELSLLVDGIDSDGTINGQIFTSDAAAVTVLDLTGYSPPYGQISDLTGIHAFSNLDSLTLYSDSIVTLDVSANTALSYLYFFGGQKLTSINVSGALALETLYCRSARSLTSLDLTNNTNLRMLDCSSTNIGTLNMPNHTNLDTVICRSANLSTLTIGNAPNLKFLDCGNNNLSSLDLSASPNLEKLYCYQNQLTNLNLANKSKLIEVWCYGNQLTSLGLTNTSALEYLECGNNNLSTIDLSTLVNLEHLDIYSNPIGALDLTNNLLLKVLGLGRCNLDSLPDLSNNLVLESLDFGGNSITDIDMNSLPALKFLGCYNNNISSLDLTNHMGLESMYAIGNNPYLQICVADVDTALNRINWYKDPSATYTENCSPLALKGRLAIDANSNCTVDSLERGLSGQVIQFVKDTTVIYVSSFDTLGNYVAHLDTGTYTVSVASPSPYWQFCPISQQITIDTSYTLQELDFALQPIVACPLLEVDIAAPFLRMTGGGSSYYVDYCNLGGVDAQNAYVEVDIDPALNVLGSSIPIASQVGTVYTFNLGTVAMAECGSFSIQVVVDTSAQFQQTHCTEAHIFPDSICIPNFWNGAILDIQASCQNDTIYFDITNKGATMPQSQQYYVFEDHLAMRTGSVQLANNQSTTVVQPVAQGSTYRMNVTQEAGFPSLLGDSVATAVVAGCNAFANGAFNLGFVTQFSNGSSSPFRAVDCQQNVASYDPNDKAAQPVGYDVQHYIYKNTDLDYKVRFQNTGTDTAFNVTILDTISEHLDITSIEMGASSHNYTWTVHNRVLRVHFANIMLPDSNVNEPLSNGFFRYRIAQKLNNPNGTLIENTAGIYFDYNPVVLTNTTFHTVGENFVATIITGTEEVLVEHVEVKVYPNPFQEQATLEVTGRHYQKLRLSVYDLMGKEVGYSQSQNNKISIQRNNLPQGVYIYRLEGDGALINTGKIIMQ